MILHTSSRCSGQGSERHPFGRRRASERQRVRARQVDAQVRTTTYATTFRLQSHDTAALHTNDNDEDMA
jgi:hypothetical protein